MTEKTKLFLPVAMTAGAITFALLCAISIEHALSSYQAGLMKVYTGKSNFHMLALHGNEFQFGLSHAVPILFHASSSLIFLGLASFSGGGQRAWPDRSKPLNLVGVLGILLLHVWGLLLLLELILY